MSESLQLIATIKKLLKSLTAMSRTRSSYPNPASKKLFATNRFTVDRMVQVSFVLQGTRMRKFYLGNKPGVCGALTDQLAQRSFQSAAKYLPAESRSIFWFGKCSV